MAPLTGILVGMVIAAFDFRINSVDVIADPVGWILIAIFAGRLAKANRWFGWTRAIAWAGALFAVPDMFGLGTQGTLALYRHAHDHDHEHDHSHDPRGGSD